MYATRIRLVHWIPRASSLTRDADSGGMQTDGLREIVITAPDAEGAVLDRREARVAVRTRTALVEAVVRRVREEHPHDVPGVVALPIVAANRR